MAEERELDKEIRACGNCDNYVPEKKKENDELVNDIWGRCHRFPPSVFKSGEVNSWKFPKVSEDNFCSEFTQKIVERLEIEVEGAE